MGRANGQRGSAVTVGRRANYDRHDRQREWAAYFKPTPEEERILERVRAMGFNHAYTVGGCERDRINGVTPKDFDISVAGHTIAEVMEKARKEGSCQELVVAGQVIGVRLTAPWTDPEGIEIALARTEVSTGGGRRAFAITAHPDITIEEDLLRRDFTCNAMARDVYTGELIDPLGGAQDIADGVLRTVSDKSFPEDPLRVMRGLARCAKDGLQPDERTFAQMQEWADDPKRYLRDHVHGLIAEYAANTEAELSDKQLAQVMSLVGQNLPREELGDHAGLVVLAENGLYAPGEPVDETALQAWSKENIDVPGRNRAVFEAATGYRWYGEVPISPERINEEMKKTLSGANAADAMYIARDTGVLGHIVPELQDAIGFDQQSKFHDMTVEEHTFQVLQRACEANAPINVRWAALLHDSGKPASAWGWVKDDTMPDGVRPAPLDEFQATPSSRRLDEDDHLHFFGRPPVKDVDGNHLTQAGVSHEELGARNVSALMHRLAADNDTRYDVKTLVAEHMYADDKDFTTLAPSAQGRRARRFLNRVGSDRADDLMLLRRCDRAGKRSAPEAGWDTDLTAFENAVAAQREAGAAVTVKDLNLNGRVLNQEGFSGVAIGKVLNKLLEATLEDPELNDSATLLNMARDLRAESEAEAAAETAAQQAEKERHRQASKAAAAAAKAAKRAAAEQAAG